MYVDDAFDTLVYRYAKIVGTGIEYQDWVKYDSKNTEAPWLRVCNRKKDGTLSPIFTSEDYDLVDQPITESEFKSVLAAYQTVAVPTTPLQEYLTEIGYP